MWGELLPNLCYIAKGIYILLVMCSTDSRLLVWERVSTAVSIDLMVVLNLFFFWLARLKQSELVLLA